MDKISSDGTLRSNSSVQLMVLGVVARFGVTYIHLGPQIIGTEVQERVMRPVVSARHSGIVMHCSCSRDTVK